MKVNKGLIEEIINEFNEWVREQIKSKPISVKEGQIKLIEIALIHKAFSKPKKSDNSSSKKDCCECGHSHTSHLIGNRCSQCKCSEYRSPS